MNISKEDKIALQQQADHMDRQAKLSQSYRDDYYGHALNCDGDYRASRRQRAWGGSHEAGHYWEE